MGLPVTQGAYNLLEEKWIPVLWRNGAFGRVGIIESLTQASQIRQIAASNPMDRVAVLRFLLGLLYWCKGNPPDNLTRGSFPKDWFKKLEDNKDCFNLLGNGKRFYQSRTDKDTNSKKLSANYLIQEVPTGINFWHFRHATEDKDGICPACCALGLLRLPVFATSGGRGKPPGINAKPPVYVIPLGSSLADALYLSWNKIENSNLGTAAWEKPDVELPANGEVPLLTGLTWLPRRVWLDDPDEEPPCISCGSIEPLIKQCLFAGIGSTKTHAGSNGRIWNDPHTITDSKDVIKPSNALSTSDSASGQWLRILDGVLRRSKAGRQQRLWVVSFATVQNDKYLEAMEYEISLSNTPSDQVIQDNIDHIQQWQKECRSLVRKIRTKETITRKSVVASIRPHVESEVSKNAGALITAGDDAWEQASGEYRPMMAAVAKSLSPGFTASAVQRRKQIASVKPDMKEQTKESRKSSKKGGGN
jgi:CRISPR type I-E-associated protein CasA/Cse1